MNSPTLSADVPAGNLRVLSIDGRTAHVATDWSSSREYWFYWRFRATFPEAAEWRFAFDGNAVGTRGPAVSHDGGRTWDWLSGDATHESYREFVYASPGPETVDFCQCIPYLGANFEDFLRARADDGRLTRGTLCSSRKGRDVPWVRLREGAPQQCLLVTTRHHAQEAMACYAAEGLLDAMRSAGPAFRDTLSRYEVLWIPFVDRDGVEDGEQGKFRVPHDHNRDYGVPGNAHLYPETAAIERLIEERRPDAMLDLHCPWLRGGTTNEHPYLVGCDIERTWGPMEEFGALLERHCPPEAPYRAADNLPFGKEWNTGANYADGMTIKRWAAMHPFVRFAQTLEIPFANFREKTQTPETVRSFGAGIAAALCEWLGAR